MVAKKQSPLAVIGNRWRLSHDVGDGEPVFLAERHVDAGHQGKMECHLALVAFAEIGTNVGRPLVGLGKNQAVGIVCVNRRTQGFYHRVSFRQVFA